MPYLRQRTLPCPIFFSIFSLFCLFFSGGTLTNRLTPTNSSTEDKFLVWLVFEHLLLLLKVLLHVVIPDHPASLAIIKARQRLVVRRPPA